MRLGLLGALAAVLFLLLLVVLIIVLTRLTRGTKKRTVDRFLQQPRGRFYAKKTVTATALTAKKPTKVEWTPETFEFGGVKRPLFLPPDAVADHELRERTLLLIHHQQTKAKSAPLVNPCDPMMELVVTPFMRSDGDSVRRLFFGVGINYTSQPKNMLTSCWNDVESLYRELGIRFGSFHEIWAISDKPEGLDMGHRSNRGGHRRPTLDHIWSAWTELLAEVSQHGGKTDIVFVYSGHGSFRLTTDPSELYGQSDCLVLLDKLLWDYDVMERMVRPLPARTNMLMVMDSCNSGSAANLPWTVNPLSCTVNQTSEHIDLDNTNSGNVMLISGCRDEQTSAAGATHGDLSACTRVLLETLRGRPAGTVPVHTLAQSMRRKLVETKDTQIPQLSLSRPQLLGTTL